MIRGGRRFLVAPPGWNCQRCDREFTGQALAKTRSGALICRACASGQDDE